MPPLEERPWPWPGVWSRDVPSHRGVTTFNVVADHKPLVKNFDNRTLDGITNSCLFRLKQRTLPCTCRARTIMLLMQPPPLPQVQQMIYHWDCWACLTMWSPHTWLLSGTMLRSSCHLLVPSLKWDHDRRILRPPSASDWAQRTRGCVECFRRWPERFWV